MNYLLGIDTSTTASKACLIDHTGQLIHCHSVTHPSFAVPNQPLWSEQDPEAWWQATSHAIQQAVMNIAVNKITSIGLTGQMQGLVILDQDNRVIRPAILWNDQRSAHESEWLAQEFSSTFLCQHIGTMPLPCHLVSKLLWLKKYEPQAYQRIAHILTPKDYIRWRLSNTFATDKSDASGYGLLDIRQRQWSKTLTRALEINVHWLPTLFESLEITSHVSVEAAKNTGLVAGIPIAAGAGDQPAQAIGCGLFIPGKISIQTGTSGVVVAIKDHYAPDPQGRFLEYCHAIDNQWISMGLTAAAAGSLRWLRDNIANHLSFRELDQMANNTPPGANGLLFIPDICGNIHPHANAFARGAFIGLMERHTLAHMARAVMEGVSFSLYEMAELMNHDTKLSTKDFMISGGAANSVLWKTIFSDVFAQPLTTITNQEGAAFGAALLAGMAKNIWSSANIPSSKIGETIQPNHLVVECYQQLYPLWQQAYHELNNINLRLSQLKETELSSS